MYQGHLQEKITEFVETFRNNEKIADANDNFQFQIMSRDISLEVLFITRIVSQFSVTINPFMRNVVKWLIIL